MNAKKLVGLVTLLAVLLGGSLVAQEAKKAPALTAEGVKQLLEGMGLDAKEIKTTEGDVIGAFFPHNGKVYNYTIELTLSPNQKWLWMVVWLKKLPDPKIPAEKLRELTSINDKIGPPKFTYHESNNMFRLKLPVFNQNITPKEMRELIEMIDLNVTTYASAWDPDKWGTASTPGEGK